MDITTADVVVTHEINQIASKPRFDRGPPARVGPRELGDAPMALTHVPATAHQAVKSTEPSSRPESRPLEKRSFGRVPSAVAPRSKKAESVQHAEAEAVDTRRRQHERRRYREVPSLCRGRRPHHARREHVGTWEISSSTGRS